MNALRQGIVLALVFSLGLDPVHAAGWRPLPSPGIPSMGLTAPAVFADQALAAGAVLELHPEDVRARETLTRRFRAITAGFTIMGLGSSIGSAAELAKKVVVSANGASLSVSDVAVVKNGDTLFTIAHQLKLPHWVESLYASNAAHIKIFLNSHHQKVYQIFDGQQLDVAQTSQVLHMANPANLAPAYQNVIVDPADFLSQVLRFFHQVSDHVYVELPTFLIVGGTLLAVGAAAYILKKKRVIPLILAFTALMFVHFQPSKKTFPEKVPSRQNVEQSITAQASPPRSPVPAPAIVAPKLDHTSAETSVSPENLPIVDRRTELTRSFLEGLAPAGVAAPAGTPEKAAAPSGTEAERYLESLLAGVEKAAADDAREDLDFEHIAQAPLAVSRVTVTGTVMFSEQMVIGKPNQPPRIGPVLEGTAVPKTGGPSRATKKELAGNAEKILQAQADLAGRLKKRAAAKAVLDWRVAREEKSDEEEAKNRLLDLAPGADLALLETVLLSAARDLHDRVISELAGARAEQAALNVVKTLLQGRAASELGVQILLRWYLGFNLYKPTVGALNLMRWGVQLPDIRRPARMDWRSEAGRLAGSIQAFQEEAAASGNDPVFQSAFHDILPLVSRIETYLDKKAGGHPKEKIRQAPYRAVLSAFKRLALGEDVVLPDLPDPASQNAPHFSVKQSPRVNNHGTQAVSNLDLSNNPVNGAGIINAGDTVTATFHAGRATPDAAAPAGAGGSLGAVQAVYFNARQLQSNAGSDKKFALALTQLLSLNNPQGPASYTRTILTKDMTPIINAVENAVGDAVRRLLLPGREAKRRSARRMLADGAVQQAVLHAKSVYLNARQKVTQAKKAQSEAHSPVEKRAADAELKTAQANLASWEAFLAEDLPEGAPWGDFQKAVRGLDPSLTLASLDGARAQERLEIAQKLAHLGRGWIDLSYQAYDVINSLPDKYGNRSWTQTEGFDVTLNVSPRQRSGEKGTVARSIATAQMALEEAERHAAKAGAAEGRAAWVRAEAQALAQLAEASQKTSAETPSTPVRWRLTLFRAENIDQAARALVDARLGPAKPERKSHIRSRLDPQSSVTAFFAHATGVQGFKTRGLTGKGGQVTLWGAGGKSAAGAEEAAEKLAQKRRRDLEREIRTLFGRVESLRMQALAAQEEYGAAWSDWKEADPAQLKTAADRLSRAIHRLYDTMGRLQEAQGILESQWKGVVFSGVTTEPFSVEVEVLSSEASAPAVPAPSSGSTTVDHAGGLMPLFIMYAARALLARWRQKRGSEARAVPDTVPERKIESEIGAGRWPVLLAFYQRLKDRYQQYPPTQTERRASIYLEQWLIGILDEILAFCHVAKPSIPLWRGQLIGRYAAPVLVQTGAVIVLDLLLTSLLRIDAQVMEGDHVLLLSALIGLAALMHGWTADGKWRWDYARTPGVWATALLQIVSLLDEFPPAPDNAHSFWLGVAQPLLLLHGLWILILDDFTWADGTMDNAPIEPHVLGHFYTRLREGTPASGPKPRQFQKVRDWLKRIFKPLGSTSGRKKNRTLRRMA